MICVCGEWIGKENEVVVEKEATASHVVIHFSLILWILKMHE